MDLQIANQTFIICGATSGFGLATAKQLLINGAKVIAIARNENRLNEFSDAYGGNVQTMAMDVTEKGSVEKIRKLVKDQSIAGILINAGGPPAKAFADTQLSDWDIAYQQLLRWKVEMVKTLLPKLLEQAYGRVLFIESASVKQPLENLVLSTSLRLSVVGLVKTLANEYPDQGINFNILAPGYHNTSAIERLISKKAESQHITPKQALQSIERSVPMKKLGDPEHLGTLAAWLLSPLAAYTNGQVFTLDGGVVQGTL